MNTLLRQIDLLRVRFATQSTVDDRLRTHSASRTLHVRRIHGDPHHHTAVRNRPGRRSLVSPAADRGRVRLCRVADTAVWRAVGIHAGTEARGSGRHNNSCAGQPVVHICAQPLVADTDADAPRRGLALGPVATSTIVANLAPPTRRAEAMGYMGNAINISFLYAPFMRRSCMSTQGRTTPSCSRRWRHR